MPVKKNMVILKALYDKGGMANTKELMEATGYNKSTIKVLANFLKGYNAITSIPSKVPGNRNTKPTLKGLTTYKMNLSTMAKFPMLYRNHLIKNCPELNENQLQQDNQ
jgi:hypothetical protein